MAKLTITNKALDVRYIQISWLDGSFKAVSGTDATAKAMVSDEKYTDNASSYEWQINNNGAWQALSSSKDAITVNLVIGSNAIRIKKTFADDKVIYSNELTYTRTKTYPVSDFWYKAIHPFGHSGVDKVVYIDMFGIQRETVLRRVDDFSDSPCTKITAYKIVTTSGAEPCTPNSSDYDSV